MDTSNILPNKYHTTHRMLPEEYLDEDQVQIGASYYEQAAVAYVAHKLRLTTALALHGGGDAGPYLAPSSYTTALINQLRLCATDDEEGRELAISTLTHAHEVAEAIFRNPRNIDYPPQGDGEGLFRAFKILRDGWEDVREIWNHLFESSFESVGELQLFIENGELH